MNGTPIATPLIVYAIVTGLMSAARNTNAKSSGSTEVFGCTLMTSLLAIICIVGFAVGAVYVLVAPPSYPLGAIIFGLIALGGLVAYPTPIILTPEKIEQLKWWADVPASGGATLRKSNITRAQPQPWSWVPITKKSFTRDFTSLQRDSALTALRKPI